MSIEEGTRGESGLDNAAVPGTSPQAQPTADMASLPAARLGTPAAITTVLDGLSAEWKVIHARHWPGRPFDTIDHVAIGPNGVFIVDSVGWRGDIIVTPDALEVNGRVRTAAVHNTQEMAREVALLLPPHLRDHCYPVICLTRDEPISGWVKAVRVCTTVTLAHLIETRDPVLTSAEVVSIGLELDAALPAVYSAPDHHRASDAQGALPPQQRKPSAGPRRAWYRTWTGRLVAAGIGVAAIAGAAAVGMHAAGKDVTLDDGARHAAPWHHGAVSIAG